jgi:hypothetical protein
MPNRAEILKQKFQDRLGLPFAEVLSKDVIEQVLAQQGIQVRQTLYTPEVTLWAWLSQVLGIFQEINYLLFWLNQDIPFGQKRIAF